MIYLIHCLGKKLIFFAADEYVFIFNKKVWLQMQLEEPNHREFSNFLVVYSVVYLKTNHVKDW